MSRLRLSKGSLDRLGAVAHGVWRNFREREGRHRKEFIAYGDLSEPEQEINRELVAAILLDAVEGGEVLAPAAAQHGERRTTEKPAVSDDMDGETDIAFYKTRVAEGDGHCASLLDVLRDAQSRVYPEFAKMDGDAIVFQKRYRRVSFWSVLLGALAIGMAILQLSDLLKGTIGPQVLPILELVAVVLTVATGVLGYLLEFKENWLLNRYKAERLRLLKFDLVLSLVADRAPTADLADHVKAIKRLLSIDLKGWTQHTPLPRVRAPRPSLDGKLLTDVVDFYRSSRLDVQIQHLSDRAESTTQRDRYTEALGLGLFSFSIICVSAHVVLELGSHDPNVNLARLFVALAAMFPALAAAVRTHRSAREFARNASRCEATRSAIQEISHALGAAVHAADAVRLMGFAEYVFECESREWMRLMLHAEWFG